MTTRFWKVTIATVTAFIILVAASAIDGAPAPPVDTDPAEAAVRATIQTYIDGHAAGCGVVMGPAFAENARLTSVTDGKLTVVDAKDYLAGFPGAPARDEEGRRRWVQSVDVAGDMAMARVILLHPRVRFVDYLTLHRVDGEWKIVHKAYHAEMR